MTRGLLEALEHALAVQPMLLDPEYLRTRFSPKIRRCVVAVNDVRLGLAAERDISLHIWGSDDVPRSTIQRLFNRTQQELERITVEIIPNDPDNVAQLPWIPILQQYSAGVAAYAAKQDYRARERLSSTLTTARDPYMLPMAISSGVLLMLHMASNDKPSRMLRIRNATRKNIDSFLECWEWLTIYAELLSLVRRKYSQGARKPRIVEIRKMLDEMLEGGMRDVVPQTQMIAALCAYIIGQFETNVSTIVQWADVYKRSSLAIDKTSKLYQRTSHRMHVRAYVTARQYANVIPIIREILADEYADESTRQHGSYTSYISWLTRSLIAERHYTEALRELDLITPQMMRRSAENVRLVLFTYRSIANALSGNPIGAFDRRLLRVALLRNETSSRRAAQYGYRFSALCALLLHIGRGGTAGGLTIRDIADKLLLLLSAHKEIRSCPRTNAFIRIVAIMEGVEHVSVAQVNRSRSVDRQLAILSKTVSNEDFEIAPYEDIITCVFGSRIAELKNPTRKR